MTAEQLQAARAAHWRQNQSPLLTLEDAQSWLEQHPLCLYLPRRAQHSLEEHALVRYMLVDDPKPLLVHCQDERFAQLAEGPQRRQAMQ